MHGDFSLNPLNYRDRVSRVLYQMGRVQLDSDANEQTESTLRFLRGLATDVIGHHGGQDGGFKLIPDEQDPRKPFRIGWGVYYVDGIRCVNMPADDFWELMASNELRQKAGDGLLITEHAESHWDQAAFEALPATPSTADRAAGHLLYLAVWERHLSAAEHDAIREVALLGPDTASRAVVVWQVRMTPAKPILDLATELETSLGIDLTEPDSLKIDPLYLALNLTLRSGARLKAFAKENTDMDACAISPEARYRGSENRLYRVEIHGSDPAAPTFKWSPDNASIVYPVRDIAGTTVSLESLGRDDRTAIMKNDWVELVDETITLKRQIHPLLQVIDVDRHRMTVTLSGEPQKTPGTPRHQILRRWASDVLPLKENQRTELSDGVEVQFSKVDAPKAGYRSGDYWLIPSRTATGNVIWPGTKDNPTAVGPHGIDEHYAPLGLFNSDQRNGQDSIADRRWRFQPLAAKIT
ncbi:MAG TPA: DUF6519 domain-containing protein [Thermoanaerobaculia bacterium]|nr:DUF6519 domain-containing protein [Thermoanaerobaculia bacterium]